MKKILKKKSTMLSLICACAVLTVFLLVVLMSPVCCIGSYKITNDENTKIEQVYNFKCGNKVNVRTITTLAGTELTDTNKDYWYYRDGNNVIVSYVDMTDEAYEKYVKELKDSALYEKTLEATALKANFYKFGTEKFGYAKNTGALVTVLVVGVIDVALIALCVMSILENMKGNKKAAKKPAKKAAKAK